MGEHFIYGAIGFILGGILGVFVAGRTCAREYKKRLDKLTEENEVLRAELRGEAERGLAERKKAAEKAEHKVNKSLKAVKANEKADKRTFEALSAEYRNDAFDEHFADRIGPDDSDDIPDEDAGLEDDDLDFDDPFDGYEPAESDDKDSDDGYEKIKLISEEQFKKDLEVRDCGQYTYYQEDGVLVDDSTQEIERDQAGILGEEAMEIIPDTEKDFLYVDNEPDDTLYEISVDHSLSYYRDVLGL